MHGDCHSAIAVLAVCAIGALWIHDLTTSLDVEQVTDDVHVLFGAGGNVGVLATGAGAVVVDSLTFRAQSVRVRERAEEGARARVCVCACWFACVRVSACPRMRAGLGARACVCLCARVCVCVRALRARACVRMLACARA